MKPIYSNIEIVNGSHTYYALDLYKKEIRFYVNGECKETYTYEVNIKPFIRLFKSYDHEIFEIRYDDRILVLYIYKENELAGVEITDKITSMCLHRGMISISTKPKRKPINYNNKLVKKGKYLVEYNQDTGHLNLIIHDPNSTDTTYCKINDDNSHVIQQILDDELVIDTNYQGNIQFIKKSQYDKYAN